MSRNLRSLKSETSSDNFMNCCTRLRQGERSMDQGGLGNNLRPQQHNNNRLVRTNIGLPAQQVGRFDQTFPNYQRLIRNTFSSLMAPSSFSFD